MHALDGRTSIELEPFLEAVTADRDHHGSRLLGLGGTVSREFSGGLSLSLVSSMQVRRHSAPDPLFGTRRVDRTLRIGFRAFHRSFQYRGFAPYVGFSLERNRSSIPIHEHRSQGLLAGLSRTL